MARRRRGDDVDRRGLKEAEGDWKRQRGHPRTNGGLRGRGDQRLGQRGTKRTIVNTGVLRGHGGIAKPRATFEDPAVTEADWLLRSAEGSVGIDEIADEDQKPVLKGWRGRRRGPEDLSHIRLELVLLLASGTRAQANGISYVGEERSTGGSKLGGEMMAFKEKMES